MSDGEVTEPGQGVHEIEGGEHFRAKGGEFYLDLLEASYAFADISAALPQGALHRDYLKGVIAWVKERTEVELNYGEADWISKKIDLLYEKRKRFFLDAFESMQTSPSSTG